MLFRICRRAHIQLARLCIRFLLIARRPIPQPYPAVPRPAVAVLRCPQMTSRPAALPLVLFILGALLTACTPEERLAILLEKHPGLFRAAPLLSDSVVVLKHDTAVTVAGRMFRLPVRTVWHYQRQERTLVLDNARSRRLLAQARSEAGIARDELAAARRANAQLVALAYPHWYQIPWFWLALVLALLLLASVAVRFFTFTPLSFLK